MASSQETGEGVHTEKLDRLIAEASASGGAERANTPLLVIGLTDALGLPRPQMASAENARNDHVFGRQIDSPRPNGSPPFASSAPPNTTSKAQRQQSPSS